MKILISAKHNDLGVFEFLDDQGKTIYEHDGYAPSIPNLCGGDYTEFTVDVETGQIVGWDSQKVKDAVAKFIKFMSEEDE